MATNVSSAELVFDLVMDPMFSWTNHFTEPTAWPLYVRRAFLLTLPLSGVVWCAICVAVIVSIFATAVTCIPSVALGRCIGRVTEGRRMWIKKMWES